MADRLPDAPVQTGAAAPGAPKAVAAQGLTALRADWRDGGQDLAVPPQRAGTLWSEPSWEEVRAEIREEARLRRETQSRSDA